MSVNRRAARRDSNEAEIVSALLSAGASVQQLSAPGCADLLVAFRAKLFLLEVKTLTGKLTPDQIAWRAAWDGSVSIVRSVEEAFAAIGAETGL